MATASTSAAIARPKRAAVDLDLGPLVKTAMTRCIHCTAACASSPRWRACRRWEQTGRGEDSEITTYLGRMLSSELQGNVVDLPGRRADLEAPRLHGASLELKKTESIDVMDALGASTSGRHQGAAR